MADVDEESLVKEMALLTRVDECGNGTVVRRLFARPAEVTFMEW